MQVDLLEAKNCLSSLIVAAEHGDEVVIARNGVPAAKIVKYEAQRIKPPGAWRGKAAYSTDWNSVQTNAEIQRLFHKAGDDVASARRKRRG